MRQLSAIVAGAALLAWPALLNAYPLVFSDTWGYIDQGYEGVSWDKPWIYGPLIRALHWGVSLWPIVPAQALLLSAVLWLTARAAIGKPDPLAHLALCLVLALISAAPWFASLAMPDNFTPLVPLALFCLAYAPLSRPAQAALLAVTTVLIASHFSHIPMAAACVATLAALHWRTIHWRTMLRSTWRPAAAFVAALLLLFATNLVGRGQATLSPTGSVFLVARLIADGPAATYLDTACPAAGYHLCDWKNRFHTDSDAFLWSSDGPIYQDAYGADRLAPEATRIIRQTVMAYPGPVLASAIRNTATQLGLVRLGDTLASDHLATILRDTIIERFPPAELSRYEASLQYNGRLRPVGDAINPLVMAALILGTLASATIAIATRRTHPALAALSVLVLVAAVANAFATGALSGPHNRYEARIAWIVLLPPILLALSRLGQARPNQPRFSQPPPAPPRLAPSDPPVPHPQPPAAARSSAD